MDVHAFIFRLVARARGADGLSAQEHDMDEQDEIDAPLKVEERPQTQTAASYQAQTTLFGVPVSVFMLPTGERVVSAESLAAVLGALALDDSKQSQALAFGRWLQSLPAEASHE